MANNFPETLYVSTAGSGEDSFLSANSTELDAIRATDDETVAEVAEYRKVSVRTLKAVVSTEVVDA